MQPRRSLPATCIIASCSGGLLSSTITPRWLHQVRHGMFEVNDLRETQLASILGYLNYIVVVDL